MFADSKIDPRIVRRHMTYGMMSTSTSSIPSLSTLVEKQKIILPDIPCRVCGKVYKGWSNRSKHEKKQHPDVIIPDARKSVTISTQVPNEVKQLSSNSSPVVSEKVLDGICETSKKNSHMSNVQVMTNGTLENNAMSMDIQTSTMDIQTLDIQNIVTQSMDIQIKDIQDLSMDNQNTTTHNQMIAAVMHSKASNAVSNGFITSEEDSPIETESSSSLESPASASETDPSISLDTDSQMSDSADLNDLEGVDLDTPVTTSPSSQAVKLETEPIYLIPDQRLQEIEAPFLDWLSQPPTTPIEQTIKARRVRKEQQRVPIQRNLRFIFSSLYLDRAILRIEDLQLELFERLDICKALRNICAQRQIKAERTYTLFLLIKKVLVYLTNKRSEERKEWLLPNTIPSFSFVDSVAMDATEERKRDALNRQVFGKGRKRPAEISVEQQDERPLLRQKSIHSVINGNIQTATDDHGHSHSRTRTLPSIPFSSAAAASAFNSAPIISGERLGPAESTRATSLDSSATLSKIELQTLSTGCLQRMQALESDFCDSTSGENFLRSRGQHYMSLLVTSILCLCLAPRSQVLKNLKIGETLKQIEDEVGEITYRAELRAEQNKNQRPTLVPFPKELSPHMNFYVSQVRPALLRGALAKSPELRHKLSHTYLFFKRSGEGPRADFSKLTQAVTSSIIGRPINAHDFRSAVVTTYYEQGATQANMNNLANIMAHDPTTARNYYYRPQLARAAADINREMTSVLLGAKHSSGTSECVLYRL